MPRPVEQVLALLRTGVKTAKELQLALGVSQPTLSRLLAGMGGQVVALGRARQTRYGLPRDVRGAGGEFPVYRISPTGDAEPEGTLSALQGGEYWWQPAAGTGELLRHLPWFIQDLRPDGFMGRAFAHLQSQELNLPARLSDWNEEHVLLALSRKGEDGMGNLILGGLSLQRYFQSAREQSAPVTPIDLPARYEAFARAALAGDPPGSSAGGEQPKFAALLAEGEDFRHVLVKFSPTTDTPSGRRWADLLICEHLALEKLRSQGLRAASTRIHVTETRTFLEVTRFDRQGRFGRLPLVSLAAVDNEFFGQLDNWPAAAARLEKAGMLSAEDADSLRRLSAFSTLIANTDQHFGNISLVEREGKPRFSLAPAYDVLPMLYRPHQGEVPARAFAPPHPDAAVAGQWESARQAALRFWATAADDERISPKFREICCRNHGIIQELGNGPRLLCG